jgi:hypothetical protein
MLNATDFSSPRYYPPRYEPWKALPPILPLQTPFMSFSPSHVLHAARTHRLRQPAWRALSNWLVDMRQRTAWAQVQFGLLGGDMELCGRKERALGMWRQNHLRESR